MSCQHNKTCGDCFSPEHVEALELINKRLTAELATANARIKDLEHSVRLMRNTLPDVPEVS